MKWFLILFFIVACGKSEDAALLTDGVGPFEHRIFVTNSTTPANFGSLSALDTLCQSEADEAGLVRDYKAIISNSSTDAKDRLNIYGAVYNVDASNNPIKIVATQDEIWMAFTKALLSPVRLDASGNNISGKVWTGSNSEGSSSAEHCSNWTSTSSGLDGQAGIIGQTGQDWLEDYITESCSSSFHIYCISQ